MLVVPVVVLYWALSTLLSLWGSTFRVKRLGSSNPRLCPEIVGAFYSSATRELATTFQSVVDHSPASANSWPLQGLCDPLAIRIPRSIVASQQPSATADRHPTPTSRLIRADRAFCRHLSRTATRFSGSRVRIPSTTAFTTSNSTRQSRGGNSPARCRCRLSVLVAEWSKIDLTTPESL